MRGVEAPALRAGATSRTVHRAEDGCIHVYSPDHNHQHCVRETSYHMPPSLSLSLPHRGKQATAASSQQGAVSLPCIWPTADVLPA